ncbi:MAG: hypothetical protein EOP04_14375 [Proteobacteria bacterium]|nr:MAG: hypothetical protein EOP04_14375 [Pseudomonadota bacterium]
MNVVQNTTWSTKTIDFGTGNGSISFASSTNSIDFVTDGGSDQTCVAPVIVGFTCGSASQSGVVNQGTAIPDAQQDSRDAIIDESEAKATVEAIVIVSPTTISAECPKTDTESDDVYTEDVADPVVPVLVPSQPPPIPVDYYNRKNVERLQWSIQNNSEISFEFVQRQRRLITRYKPSYISQNIVSGYCYDESRQIEFFIPHMENVKPAEYLY